MRLPILAATASAMALALAGPAGAISHGGEGDAQKTEAPQTERIKQTGAQARAEGPDDVQVAFSRFDINMDGSLDSKELAFAHFAALDGDSNGILSESEYQETFLVRMDTVPDRTWTFADIDGDGNAEITDIEFVEAFTAAETMPPGIDTNDDKRITLAEFADAARTNAVSMKRGAGQTAEQQAQMPDDALDAPVTGLMFEGGDSNPQGADQENLSGATSPPSD